MKMLNLQKIGLKPRTHPGGEGVKETEASLLSHFKFEKKDKKF